MHQKQEVKWKLQIVATRLFSLFSIEEQTKEYHTVKPKVLVCKKEKKKKKRGDSLSVISFHFRFPDPKLSTAENEDDKLSLFDYRFSSSFKLRE